MRKCVIADLMALGDDAPQQIRISLAILADHKESRRHIFFFKNVEDCRRPGRIRAIVEGKRNRARMIAGALDHI